MRDIPINEDGTISIFDLAKLKGEEVDDPTIETLLIELEERLELVGDMRAEGADPQTICRVLRAVSQIALTICALIGA